MIEQDGTQIIVDVRTQEEYDSGHIPGAICIPNESIGDRKGNAMKQYIVDAFTDKPFSGNPAAVCGSAHCQIADYWSGELNKKQITAYQASKRGGYLYCEMREDGRINISGKAALVAVSDVMAEL